MADKPDKAKEGATGRLGGLGKGRKFAPKRPTKQAAKPGGPGAARGADASTSQVAGQDDAFAALMEQARLAKVNDRRSGAARKSDKLQVAFGGADGQSYVEKGTYVIKGKAPGQSGGPGSGKGGGGGSKGGGRNVKTEDGELDFDMLAAKDEKEKKWKRKPPFLEGELHYPTMLPFQDVDAPHDPDVLSKPALPEDLAELPEPPDTGYPSLAELNRALVDGRTMFVQLPAVLPSTALLELSRQAVVKTEPGTSSHRAETVEPNFVAGPNVLHSLPAGKVGSIKVMKSGKVRMRVGCTEFVLMPGIDVQTRSELHMVNIRTGDLVMVGEGEMCSVAALDVESLISQHRTDDLAM